MIFQKNCFFEGGASDQFFFATNFSILAINAPKNVHFCVRCENAIKNRHILAIFHYISNFLMVIVPPICTFHLIDMFGNHYGSQKNGYQRQQLLYIFIWPSYLSRPPAGVNMEKSHYWALSSISPIKYYIEMSITQ